MKKSLIKEARRLQELAGISPTSIDFSKIESYKVDYDPNDYPEFTDASLSDIVYDGRPATDSETEEINNDYEFVHKAVMNHIH